MTTKDKAERFAALHIKGRPLILTNIWDAGSAKAVADSDAAALATGSWSVAAAQGFRDGEAMPLDLLEQVVRRIVATVDLPLSVDFEGAYAVEPGAVADNVERIVSAGAIGINFEDGVVGQGGVHDVALHCKRIEAIRARIGAAVFINARTDLFLQEQDTARHAALLDPAIERARAYAEAGASGVFAPGLVDERLIEALCAATALPVNIMMKEGAPSPARLGELGASRVSFGPLPYMRCMEHLRSQALSAVQTS